VLVTCHHNFRLFETLHYARKNYNMNSTYLSIVIPAYNEEKNIEGTLSEIEAYLLGKEFTHEVILIDDGSIDWTVMKAKEFESRIAGLKIIESRPNHGKGYVIRKAMLEARGEYVLFMDADNSTTIKEFNKFLPVLSDKFAVYIASRRMSGSSVKVPFARRALGFVYILMARIILGIGVSDINCGFKVYTQTSSQTVFKKQLMNDWSFDAENLFVAKKYGYKVKEIPVEWKHKYTSKVKPIRDGLKSFWSLVKIRLNDLFGKYNGK
jgi:dolichyl-phosphate beta-glucosyltransferase